MNRRRFWKGLHKSRAASLRYARRVEGALKALSRLSVSVARSVNCSIFGGRLVKTVKFRYRVAVAVAGLVFVCVPQGSQAYPGETSVATVAGLPGNSGSANVTIANGLQDVLNNLPAGVNIQLPNVQAPVQNLPNLPNLPVFQPQALPQGGGIPQLPLQIQNIQQQNPAINPVIQNLLPHQSAQPNAVITPPVGMQLLNPGNMSYPIMVPAALKNLPVPVPSAAPNANAAVQQLINAANGGGNAVGAAGAILPNLPQNIQNTPLQNLLPNIQNNPAPTHSILPQLLQQAGVQPGGDTQSIQSLVNSLTHNDPGGVRPQQLIFNLADNVADAGGSAANPGSSNVRSLILSITGSRGTTGSTSIANTASNSQDSNTGASSSSGTQNGTPGASNNSSNAQGIDFNLQSPLKTFVADISEAITITVGGHQNADGSISGGVAKTVNPGDHVSAAEYAAIHQVAGGSTQTLVLNQAGMATDGYMTLSAGSNLHIDDLRVPYNVELHIVGYTDTNPLEITGSAYIGGSVYSTQYESGLGSSFSADSVHISGSGSWSGNAPSGSSGTYSSTSLTFNTENEFGNFGSILSSGTITINSNGSFENGSSGSIDGSGLTINSGSVVTNAGSLIASAGSVNISSGAGSIVNTGLIQATSDINFSTPGAMHLEIVNSDGTIRSGNNINIGDPSYTAKIDTTLTGGDWYSKKVNITSGDGHIYGDVNDVSGQVNMKGGLAHFYADTENLNIGNVSVTGDPAFTNTGNMEISGDITTGGAPLALIAGGDIITTTPGLTISTTGATGGDLTIIAGAEFSVAGGVITVTGPKSPDGGKIDFSTNAISNTSLDTRGTAGAGGDVRLIAFDGEGLNSGRILIPTAVTIQTAGSAGNAGGDVLILGADRNAAASNSIVMGGINTYGDGTTFASAAGTGNVTIGAADITLSGPIQINEGTGAIISAPISMGAALPRGISITGSIITNGGNVDIRAGQTANSPANALAVTGNIDTSVKSGSGDGGAVTISIASANTFNIGGGASTTNGVGGFIHANAGPAGGSGGAISITNRSTGGITVSGSSTNLQALSTAGAGGSIYLNATTGNINLRTGAYNVSGAGGNFNGGRIELLGANLTISGGNAQFLADGSGTGDGGEIIIRTTSSSSNLAVGTSSGQFTVNATGGGNGGIVTLAAGNNLSVNMASLNAGPTGANGDGATIHLEAGAGTAPSQGRLAITGNVSANGVGTGNGGTVELISNSSTTFDIGAVSVNSISGSISANAGTTGDAGTISVVNRGSGGIRVADALGLSASATNGDGGTIVLDATLGATDGVLTFSNPTVLDVSAATSGNGGTVILRGSQVTTTGNTLILAFGADTGNGGNVNITATAATSDITVGSGNGTFGIGTRSGANGGNGGIITVSAGRNVTVEAFSFDAAPSATGNGDGAILTFTAGTGGSGNLNIGASLNADGAGTGNGGQIYLTSASTQTFTINGNTTNGINGTLSANGTNGGVVSVVNNGTAGGNGGITLVTLSDVSATATNGNGGTIILDAASSTNPDGAISVGEGTLVNRGAVDGDGGTVRIVGSTLNVAGNGLLTIDTDRAGTGDGGTIYVATTANNSDLVIAGPASSGQRLVLEASGANGGSISVLAGNNLLVDSAFITANNNNGVGGHYTLEAGNGLAPSTGNLFVFGSLDASGAAGGGSIRLVSQSSNEFIVNGGMVTNGISGTLNASATTSGSGGTIEIINQGSGGVRLSSTTDVNASAAGTGNGGRIYLDASGGVLTVPVTAANHTLNVSAVGSGNGGTIDLRGANVNVVPTSGGAALELLAQGTINGNGGLVRIWETGTTGIVVGDTPGAFNIDVRGGTSSGNGGVIDLRSPGNLTIDADNLQTGPRSANGNGADITLYAGNQGCGGTTGNLILTGDLNADGVGTGNGGIIRIGVNSTTRFDIAMAGLNGVSGIISARGGTLGGNGGQVYIKNWNTGGIAMTQPADILVTATNGNGGVIDLDAAACSTNPGDILIGTSGSTTLDASAGGGNFNGGTINLRGDRVNISGGSILLAANGSGTGNGGTVHITTLNATTGDISIGTSTNNVQVQARSGLAGGNGGNIIMDAAHNLIANSGDFTVASAGNGNGGGIYLHAGMGGSGLLQLTGDVAANGSGTGNGGTVEITLPLASSITGSLLVGTTGNPSGSWISGSILAAAPGSGTGGNVTIQNTSASDLNVELYSTISAGTATGVLGNVNFRVQNSAVGSGQDILVTSPTAGAGTLTGFVNATANQVSIKADATNEVLNAGVITGTDGMVILDASNTGGQIRVGEGRRVSATQDILMTTNQVTINGTVTTSEANGNVKITSLGDLRVIGEGTVATTGTGTNLIEVSAADGRDLFLTSNINYVPTTAASTVRFGAQGTGGDIFVSQATSQTIASGALLQIWTPTLHLGNASGFNATGASRIEINDGFLTNGSVVIETAGGGQGTISTNGGTGIYIIGDPGNSINFTTLGAGTSTLNLNGAPVHIEAYGPGSSVNVESNNILSSNNNICIELDGGTSAAPSTLINDGIIRSTSTAANAAINVGPGHPTLGSDTNYVDIKGDGTIELTGNPVGGLIQIHAFDDRLAFYGDQIINAGTNATSSVTIGGYEDNGGPGVEMKDGSSITLTGGRSLNIKTYSLEMEQNSFIQNNAANSPINITLGTITACDGTLITGNGDITITTEGTGASAGRIQSNNSAITITPTAGRDLTFNTIGGVAGELVLNSGTAAVTTTVSNANTTVATNTSLSIYGSQLTMNVNNGTLQNDGFIRANTATNNAGRIDILSTGTLNVPTITNISVDPRLAGNNANGGRIDIIATGDLDLGSGTISANGVATTTDTTGNGGIINISGATVDISGGNLILRANGTGSTANGGTISFSALGATGDITTGGGTGFVSMEATAGTNGNGGIVNVTAGRNLELDGTAINVNAGATGNGGAVNVTASNAVGNGTLTLSTGITARGGTTSGNGGTITITNNSINDLVINQALDVSAGNTGAGGRIEIRNEGGGDIDVQTELHADSNGIDRNAGTIWIDANGTGTDGNVILDPKAFSATALGTGTGNGGTITIEGGQIQLVGATAKSIVANGATTGNGGTINLTATAADGDIRLDAGSGGLTLAARGGTTSGNGGTINLTAGNDIAINGSNTVLDVSPRGTNGNGGNLSLKAGQNSASGLVQVNGELNADGRGTGNGGTIAINYRDPAGGDFIVGATSTGSYVNGSIHADAPGTGTGGTVTFTNADAAGVAVGDMNIQLVGTTTRISAGSGVAGTANLGTLNFNNTGFAVDVYGLNAGDGTLTGRVNSSGTDVHINPRAATTTLVAGSIFASAGDAFLEVDCNDNSQIILTTTSQVVAAVGDAHLKGDTINNAGLIQGASDARLEFESLTNTGTIRAVNDDVYFDACIAGQNLTVTFDAPGVVQNNNGDIRFNTINYGGTITLNGGGQVGTNPNGEIVFGNALGANTVDASVGSFVGNITGVGTVVTISSQNGDINVGTATNSLSSTTGDLTITANGIATGGNIIFNGDASAAEELRVTASPTGDVTLNSGADLSAGHDLYVTTGAAGGSLVMAANTTIDGTANVYIRSSDIDMSAGSNSISSFSNLYIDQSGPNGVNIEFGEGSSLNATRDIAPQVGNIRFNTLSGFGDITIDSPGLGSINAGNTIRLNTFSSTNATLISVDSIDGDITGGGSTISITVENGDLHLGSRIQTSQELIANTGDLTATAQGVSNGGSIYLTHQVTATRDLVLRTDFNGDGTVSMGAFARAGRNVDIDTSHLIVGETPSLSQLRNTNGTIDIYNSAGAHTLNVDINYGANITTESGGDITFNKATGTGAITVSYLSGFSQGIISAGDSAGELGHVTFHGGTATGGTGNPVDVRAQYIHGCIGGTGDPFEIRVQQASPLTGNTHLGNITTNEAFYFDSPGNVVVCGPIRAIGTGSSITIDADRSAGYSITHEDGADVIADGFVRYLTQQGSVSLGAGADIRAGVAGGFGIDSVFINADNVTLGATAAGDNSSISALGQGEININSFPTSAGLSVTMAAGSVISTERGDIDFNSPFGPYGSITINGGPGQGGNGVIQAGTSLAGLSEVTFNADLNSPVYVDVNSITGYITGQGSPFTIRVVNESSVTNDVRFGNVTTNQDFTFTSPGDIGLYGTIAANGATTDVTLTTAAGGYIYHESGSVTNAGGNVAYNTGGGTITLGSRADIIGGTGVNLDAATFVLNAGTPGDQTTILAPTGNITIRNSNGTRALDVTMEDETLIQTTTGHIYFNGNTAGDTGAITINGGTGSTGNIEAGTSSSVVNAVVFNGGLTNPVNVGVNHIHGCIYGTGTPFNINVQEVSPYTGDVHLGTISTNTDFVFNSPGPITVCGNITANGAGSDITLNTTAGSYITHEDDTDVTAGGIVSYNTTGGPITLGAGSDITGAQGVNLEGSSIALGNSSGADSSSIYATDGDVILRNAAGGHGLVVNLPNTSFIQAFSGDVYFNEVGAEGAITVNGGTSGTTGNILAGDLANTATMGHVRFNGGTGVGGTGNQVSVGVNYIYGCVGGTGDAFSLSVVTTAPTPENSVHLGDITTNVDFSFTSPGNLVICGPITANGAGSDITLGASVGRSITQDAGASVTSGGDTNYNTNLLVLNDTTNATGAINVNTTAAAPLEVNIENGGALNAGTNVNLIGTQGLIVATATSGSISANSGAGAIQVQGGTGSISVDITAANGRFYGHSDTTVNISIDTGNVQIGTPTNSLTSGSDMQVVAVGGGIDFRGNASSGGFGNFLANNGNIGLDTGVTVDAVSGLTLSIVPGSTAPLTVTLGAGSTLQSDANIFFNDGVGTESDIIITGSGTIDAEGDHVYYYVGNNDLSVDVTEILGCNHLESSTGSLASVFMQTQQGSIDFCTDINTSNAAGNGGDIFVNAVGGPVNLENNNVIASGNGAGNSGGSITIRSGSGGITNGGDIISNGTGGANGGSIELTAPNQNIVVNTLQAFATGGGNGGNITTLSSNLSVMACGPNGAGIDVTGFNGGVISVTTTSTNPFIVGQPVPNGVACNISANGTNDGGHVGITSNGGTVENGHSVTANGGTGNGGVVTFNPNNPTGPGPTTWIVDGDVSAVGGNPGTGVVGFGAGPDQDMNLYVGTNGTVSAGQQITLGNLDPFTGIQVAPPSGLITVRPLRPFSTPMFPAPQFNTPTVVVNGTLNIMPAPPGPPGPPGPPAPGFLPGGNGNAGLIFGGLALLTDVTRGFDGQLIPTDQTKLWSGYDATEDNEDQTRSRQLRKGKKRRLIPGSATWSTQFELADQEVNRLKGEGIQVAGNTKETYFHLEKGNVLFMPNKDIVVGTKDGRVFIPAGSMAFIMHDGNEIAIFDLHQRGQNGVQVVAGDKLIKMDPGRMVLLSSQNVKSLDELQHDALNVAYRQPEVERISANLLAHGADFSLPSAFNNVIPLKKMLNSENPQEKKVVNKLLMNAVLLEEQTRHRGPFRTVDLHP